MSQKLTSREKWPIRSCCELNVEWNGAAYNILGSTLNICELF
jgi:hypothetical protein